MLPNTEVIIISSFDLLSLQVKTQIVVTKQYLYWWFTLYIAIS